MMCLPASSPMLRQNAGFTLLELLVVIAIVSILSMLALAGLSNSRKSAQNTECLSRLRAIGIGLLQYTAENNGRLLPGAVPEYPYRSWYNVLDPYMGGQDTDYASGNRPKWTQCPARTYPVMNEFTVGYGWNFSSFGFGFWEEVWAGGYNSTLQSVSQPSKTIIIGDSTDLRDNELRYRLLYPGTDPSIMAHRHSGRGNYLFLDGHVSAYTPTELNENQYLFKKTKPSDQ